MTSNWDAKEAETFIICGFSFLAMDSIFSKRQIFSSLPMLSMGLIGLYKLCLLSFFFYPIR
jgi:hypothetical protein